jgi:hypothetical protein
VRVIDVTNTTPGMILQILMNGELDEALAVLAEPTLEPLEMQPERADVAGSDTPSSAHWRWRLRSVEYLAERMDPSRFGVKALYLFGSTQNGTAGPQSDIDLLIHFTGTKTQEKDLMTWLEGWSLCLSHLNYLRTGYKTDGLLSVHLITDQDIRNRTSYAVKIGATSDPALLIPIGQQSRS